MKECIVLFSLMALMLSFSGCGKTRLSSAPEVSLPPASLSVRERQDASEKGSESGFAGLGDPAGRSPGELVGAALEIYNWFAEGRMPLAQRTRVLLNPQTGEEETFQLVDSPYFSNYEQMKEYLRGFFSEEIVQRLLEQYPVCRDIDGELYMLAAGEKPKDFLKEAAFFVEEERESFIRLSAEVSDGQEPQKTRRYEFVCQKAGGKWVFTTFAGDWQ